VQSALKRISSPEFALSLKVKKTIHFEDHSETKERFNEVKEKVKDIINRGKEDSETPVPQVTKVQVRPFDKEMLRRINAP